MTEQLPTYDLLSNHETITFDINDIDHNLINAIESPEHLRSLVEYVLKENHRLQQELLDIQNTAEIDEEITTTGLNRLEQINHGITELNERMTKPYVMSPEMKTTLFSLETLAQQGGINSLILEGEPGTGKTQLVYSLVGEELSKGNDVALVHVRIKDTMSAQEMLYTIDNVRRLSDSQSAPLPPEISQEASQWKQKILKGKINPKTDPAYLEFSDKLQAIAELSTASNDLSYDKYIDMGPLGEAIIQSSLGKKVYLLIDEIEKGREELMTGLLDEIENLTFNIPEINDTVTGDKTNLRIFITTNTEESHKIPSAFRRRCLYSFVDYPDHQQLSEIVEANYPNINQDLLGYALDAFEALHHDPQLHKKPSTPELLSWIALLQHNYNGQIPEELPYREVLLKHSDDFERANQIIEFMNLAKKIWNDELIHDQDINYYLRDKHTIYEDSDVVEYLTQNLDADQDTVFGALRLIQDRPELFPYEYDDDDEDEDDEYDNDEEYDDDEYDDKDDRY